MSLANTDSTSSIDITSLSVLKMTAGTYIGKPVKVMFPSMDMGDFSFTHTSSTYISSGIKVFFPSISVDTEIKHTSSTYIKIPTKNDKIFNRSLEIGAFAVVHQPADEAIDFQVQSILYKPISFLERQPLRDGTIVLSTANKDVVIERISNDTYFNQDSKIYRVDVYYLHESGQQNKRVIHVYPTFSSYTFWSIYSKPGLWRKILVRAYDFDGAEIRLRRESIGDQEDLVIN